MTNRAARLDQVCWASTTMTVTQAVSGAAKSRREIIAATNVVLPGKVCVGRGLPFHSTTLAPGWKCSPATFMTRSGLPATALSGTSALMCGAEALWRPRICHVAKTIAANPSAGAKILRLTRSNIPPPVRPAPAGVDCMRPKMGVESEHVNRRQIA
jgi:hypothetical protein